MKKLPTKNHIVSMRVPRTEVDQLEDDAERAGLSLSAYVRAAVKERIQGGQRCYTTISGLRQSTISYICDAPEYWTTGSVATFTIELTMNLAYRTIDPTPASS